MRGTAGSRAVAMLVASAGLIVACNTVTTGNPAAAVPPREGPTPAMVATQTASLAPLESPHPAVPRSTATKGSLHPTSPVESQPKPIAPPAPAEIAQEVADAWLAVQTEWRTLLPGGWPLPTAWNGDGLYDAWNRHAFPGSWMQGPSCGGTLAPPGNATYCWANDTVSWDLEFFRESQDASGPLAIVETMAHELGHAAQARLHQAGQDELIWPQMELQADCFAGAILYEASGDGLIDVPPGGLDELYAFMSIISDSEPAFGRGQHGNQRQREMSFALGQGQIGACFTSTGPPIDIAFPIPLPAYPVGPDDPHETLIMPSRNIWCGVSSDHIECTIREFSFDGQCVYGDMPLVTLDAIDEPRRDSCGGRGILTDALEPIEYGQTFWLPPAMCTAERTGLTCMNDAGHGFTLARAGLHTF